METIYYEAYTEREHAEGREKYLKSGAGRRFLRSKLRKLPQKVPSTLSRAKGFASGDLSYAAVTIPAT